MAPSHLLCFHGGERDSGFLHLLIGTLEVPPHSIGAPFLSLLAGVSVAPRALGRTLTWYHSKMYYHAQASPPALLLDRVYAAQADLELTL